MYYRVAIRREGDHPGESHPWKWYSTVLGSLNAAVLFFNHYRALPLERLRVFSSSSREELREQLLSEDNGLGSNSVPALQFLRKQSSSVPEETSEAPAHRTREPASIGCTKGSSHTGNATDHVPSEKGTSSLDRRREETESGAGSDHDLPYRFTFPSSWQEVRAWMRLRASFQRGEMQS